MGGCVAEQDVGVANVDRDRVRVTRAGFVAVGATLVLAAGGTAAYSFGGRRSPAAAHVPVATPAPLAVRLSAGAPAAPLRYGATVTVTGLLRDAAGNPLSGRGVEVRAARFDAPSNVTVVGSPTSDGRGRVSVAFRPAAGSSVWLAFDGSPGLEPAVSEPVRVTVAPAVTVKAETRRVRGGWRATLRGTVVPASAGQRVRLDRRVGGRWVAASVGTLGKKGAFSFSVRKTSPGTYRYRVVRPGGGAFAPGEGAYDLRLALPRAARLPSPKGNGGPGRLLVTGDSFAYYLGQQLTTARKPRDTVVESRPSTGLARPDYYDWAARAKQQVTSRPGAVVAFLGANDCQPIRVGGTGRWATTGSAAWVTEYRRRAAGLMRTYSGGGVRPVVWVGLPIAQRADIAACYRAMNAATSAAARDVRGVTWVDTWAMYAVQGRYSPTVRGVAARQDDGIHLTFAGTRFLTRVVYGLLR
jgi:lysophospholipase L1-like esterase